MSHETWWDIFTNPAHIVAEMAWTLIFDGVVVFLLWNKLFKGILKRVTHHVHKEIDKEHGYEH